MNLLKGKKDPVQDSSAETKKEPVGNSFAAGYNKFKQIMGKIIMTLYHLRKVVMAVPVAYVALRMAAYNMTSAGASGRKPADHRRVCHADQPLRGGDRTSGNHRRMSGDDVLFQESHVRLGHQYFHFGAANTAAGQQHVSGIMCARILFDLFKDSSPTAKPIMI